VSDHFIDRLTLIQTLPCLAEPGKIIVVGRPSRPLAGVLPYVNAVLPNVLAYSPTAATMTLRRQPGFITLYPDKVYITQVKDAAEGLVMLEAVRELLNQIWARRAQIVPAPQARRQPGFIDIWKLMPRTNCKRCGQPACLTFAAKLTMGLVRLNECPVLLETSYAGLLAQLRAVIVEAPLLGEEAG